jgi:hypothetical protein
VLCLLVGRAEAKFPQRPFETGIAGGCFGRVFAFELGINLREARSRRICRFAMKIATGVLGRVTDQNLLPRNIFVWMHFFLASRANIRILHNANSRQTRQKEREGRCMEDATIN